MLMDDPRDWQARMDSLNTAVLETTQLMLPVIEAHLVDVAKVFGAQNLANAKEDPFTAVQTMLGQITPAKFLKQSATNRQRQPDFGRHLESAVRGVADGVFDEVLLRLPGGGDGLLRDFLGGNGRGDGEKGGERIPGKIANKAALFKYKLHQRLKNA